MRQNSIWRIRRTPRVTGERERRLRAQRQQQLEVAAALRAQALSTRAWERGLHESGSATRARMAELQRDVAERCRKVERGARDDVRRGAVGGVSPRPRPPA